MPYLPSSGVFLFMSHWGFEGELRYGKRQNTDMLCVPRSIYCHFPPCSTNSPKGCSVVPAAWSHMCPFSQHCPVTVWRAAHQGAPRG